LIHYSPVRAKPVRHNDFWSTISFYLFF
jgi:hypothetical protein